MKAYACNWDNVTSVRYAETASKARYRCWLLINDIFGVDGHVMTQIAVRRWPEMDRYEERAHDRHGFQRGSNACMLAGVEEIESPFGLVSRDWC